MKKKVTVLLAREKRLAASIGKIYGRVSFSMHLTALLIDSHYCLTLMIVNLLCTSAVLWARGWLWSNGSWPGCFLVSIFSVASSIDNLFTEAKITCILHTHIFKEWKKQIASLPGNMLRVYIPNWSTMIGADIPKSTKYPTLSFLLVNTWNSPN